jgi:hypothetical protein
MAHEFAVNILVVDCFTEDLIPIRPIVPVHDRSSIASFD